LTLVLGAGVAGACNVATWRELALRLWREAFGHELPEIADDPHFYPFVFEHVQAALGDRFAERLKETLYANHHVPSREELLQSRTNTLAVVARVVAREACRREKRLIRVITLNVDDLLEQAVSRLLRTDLDTPRVVPIVRGTLTSPPSGPDAALPIYHLHGYLRSAETPVDARHGEEGRRDASDVLVFTDLQYWASAAIPSSHMNRTFSFALHDSHCVFIGTSMLDLNIWRWLALRTFEIATDCDAQCQGRATSRDELESAYRASLQRHYWITTEREQGKEFLSSCLALRGVATVHIGAWNDESLQELMDDCFPEASRAL
jgi:hypothetical protein